MCVVLNTLIFSSIRDKSDLTFGVVAIIKVELMSYGDRGQFNSGFDIAYHCQLGAKTVGL